MKLTVAMLMVAGVLYGQGSTASSTGPQYDSIGHLVGYVYPDGKSEHYAYDSSWRMIRYIDREGGITTFTYTTGGSMTVVNPDGSIGSR